MRTETDKLQRFGIRLAVDEDQVGPDMAISAIAPLSAKGMIAVARRQRDVGSELPHNVQQGIIKLLTV